MAFKLRGTGTNVNKQYLFLLTGDQPFCRQWAYVCAEAATSVDASAYISTATDDGELAVGMLKIGDMIWSYHVGSISDNRTIADDIKTGVTDLSLHLVLDNTGSIIDLSDDLLGATVTYGD